MAEQSINIPQVLVFLVVSFLAVRWYFSKPSASGFAPAQRPTRRLNAAHIDQIAQMFPQLNRNDIAWDLQRNGSNVAATTERALSGRGLDAAPPSYIPPPPADEAPRRAAPLAAKSKQPDLITRYNLSSKVGQAVEPPAEAQPKAKAWSQDRNERQMNLARRREEMVLAARRKLEQQEKGKGAAA